MSDRALFVNAHHIPYEVFEFSDLQEELTLKSGENLEDFFNRAELLLKKGFYLCGFLSYELGYFFENRLKSLNRTSRFPLAGFKAFKSFKRKRVFFKKVSENLKVANLNFNVSKEEYREAIKKIKEYISQGDVYQINYTFKAKFSFLGEPFELFKALLFSQRCKYACYLPFKDFWILSLSPERFLEKRGSILKSSPMKGTVKRGKSLREDDALKRFLKRDEKTQAENIMIVDLIRNDLGRCSLPGSVFVSELFKVETYPTLHQLISTVKGRLKNKSLLKIFKGLFPCGSVTGAPKIRAMEIIAELEKEPREVYTGAVGIIFPNGDFTFNVAIRTLILKKLNGSPGYEGEAGIGSGVVWDSNEDAEYDECLLKARFFTNPILPFSLIETMFVEGGRIKLLKYHYSRLKQSLKFFRLRIPEFLKTFKDFRKFLEKSLVEAGFSKIERLKLRLEVFPEGGWRLNFDKFEPWRESLKVLLVKRDYPATHLCYFKTSFRKHFDDWFKRAKSLGYDEVVFYDERGRLLEGTISSVFLKRGDKFVTPPLDLGVLRGVLREYMFKTKVAKEGEIYLEDLKEPGAEFYIGNAVRGLGKVKSVDIVH